jgi:putative heme-binding domain-containing protein
MTGATASSTTSVVLLVLANLIWAAQPTAVKYIPADVLRPIAIAFLPFFVITPLLLPLLWWRPPGEPAAARPTAGDWLQFAIAAGAMPAADLERQTAATLWSFPDAAVRSLAVDVLGPEPPANREPLVVSYRASLPRQGDAVAGKAIFRQQCAACHRVDGEGREIGPALSAVKTRGPEAFLLGILDPNREALPGYLAHAAVTGDGRVVTGIVVAQSDGSVTLRTADGTDTTIPRDDLESFTNTKRSLMPEGFEKTIDARGMADLIAYLMSAP